VVERRPSRLGAVESDALDVYLVANVDERRAASRSTCARRSSCIARRASRARSSCRTAVTRSIHVVGGKHSETTQKAA
jgi:hypothetical protein